MKFAGTTSKNVQRHSLKRCFIHVHHAHLRNLHADRIIQLAQGLSEFNGSTNAHFAPESSLSREECVFLL